MASAIFNGKDIENRTWSTKFRGRVIIHASKTFNMGHYQWMVKNNLCVDMITFGLGFFVQGALIGEVDIIDCVRGHSSPWAFSDQYNFVLANPMLYKTPIPCRGMLRFFEPKLMGKKGEDS